MPALPSDQTPLNQHSLRALEQWLRELGAEPASDNPCLWVLSCPDWSAQLLLDREELKVIWQQPGQPDRQCLLPYGLPRADVAAAIEAGP